MDTTPASQREKETTALIHGVAFFVATAIENALKARIVQRRPDLVAEKLSGPLGRMTSPSWLPRRVRASSRRSMTCSLLSRST
jgi:hypothetical protein